MGNAILVYLIIQLLSTAYGLSVIEAVRPVVNKKLIDDGYVLKNKNSMYRFNEGLTNFAKGLIPFYYTIKAINLVKGSDAVERAAIEEIRKGNYITLEEALNPVKEESFVDDTIASAPEPVISFEKYVARKNELPLYETNEDEIEYDTINEVNEDKQVITPFDEKLVDKTPKKAVEDKVIRLFTTKDITSQDLINMLRDLTPGQIRRFIELLNEYVELKEGRKVLQLKDVATIDNMC